MPQQRLYHDYVDNKLIPYWYVLSFELCQINWEKSVYYYEAIKPFEFVERHEFDESLISVSINLSDFIFNYESPNKIGLNLRSIRRRIERYGLDPSLVQQFVLSTPEIEELLMMLPEQRKMIFATKFYERSK